MICLELCSPPVALFLSPELLYPAVHGERCLPLQVQPGKLKGAQEVFPDIYNFHCFIGLDNSVYIASAAAQDVFLFHVTAHVPTNDQQV